VRLPNATYLSKTNDEDPVEYYYRPLTGRFYRRRLEMALKMLGDRRFERALEIGCGSGIFLPALCERARRVSAFDVHGNMGLVSAMLRHEGLQCNLWTGDALRISVRDGTFDAVICLSVLEHLAGSQLDSAIAEIKRVSRPGAAIVLGFPCRNVITDTFYRVFGFSPRSIHPSSHEDIGRAVVDCLDIEESCLFAPWLPASLNVYNVYLCTWT
jgi:ubiquinone/menaquinone biosynthesis C-methylase UbiE